MKGQGRAQKKPPVRLAALAAGRKGPFKALQALGESVFLAQNESSAISITLAAPPVMASRSDEVRGRMCSA